MDYTTRHVAQTVAGSILLLADRGAQQAAIDYWEFSQHYHESLVEAAFSTFATHVQRKLRALKADTSSAAGYRAAVETMATAMDHDPERHAAIAPLAWSTESNSRLSIHVGARYGGIHDGRDGSFGNGHTQVPHRTCATPRATVVIPFRETRPGPRLRNLLVCLHSLADQTVLARDYNVIVVESDAADINRRYIEPLVSQYIHAYSIGPFNKAWTINVGVAYGSAVGEYLCLLDADMLVGRDFIERNLARFQQAGRHAFWPFRDILFLDESSSFRATRARISNGVVDLDELRGVFLRRPPGGCIWVRSEAFRRLGGMDERFVGWGGEDLDFGYRVDRYFALDRLEDILLHLHHPRPLVRTDDGRTFYDGVAWASWPLESAFGQLGSAHSDSEFVTL